MKKNEPKEKTFINEGRYSSVHIHMLYKLMLFRQFHDLTAREVSYLVGKKATYFSDIEEFKSLEVRLNEIFYRVSMLGNIHPANLFEIDPNIYELPKRYRMTKIVKKESTLYTLEIIENEEGTTLLYTLTDKWPQSDHYFAMEEKNRKELEIVVQKMLDDGYFLEKIEPYKLYKRCKEEFKLHIRPLLLEQTMMDFVKSKKNSLKLKYDKEDSFSFRTYYTWED